jgi:hypothetical protein
MTGMSKILTFVKISKVFVSLHISTNHIKLGIMKDILARQIICASVT